MDIVIACGAMPFGPATLETRSLGGSETAALMLGKELAKRGHKVKMFCNLPDPSRPDHFRGGKADDGVQYLTLDQYRGVGAIVPSDLTIIVRDPGLAAIPTLTRKKVLWSHDIYTKRGMQKALEQMEWTIDEIWTVSEWHRQQVHKTTGYPLEKIVALRNGIVKVETLPSPRSTNQLIYAARPERGLDNLIQPGGVMEHLKDYELVVAMYDHFPDHMRDYYAMIVARMQEMPNVRFVGSLPQAQLRQLIRESAAYIYPTQFEETSCILARECIEQGTPFLTTRVGALPETLKTEGLFFDDWYKDHPELDAIFDPLPQPEPGSPAWCKMFSHFVRDTLNDIPRLSDTTLRMSYRDDLYWDGVAAMVEAHAAPVPAKGFSRAWSLMQDGDVIAAREYLMKSNHDDPPEAWSPGEATLWHEIETNYPFLKYPGQPGYQSQKDYYEWVYEHKRNGPDSELVFRTDATNPRIEAVAAEIAKLPPGARVVEYGCGPGHLLAALAVRFPDKMFVGVEISQAAVEVLNDGAHERNMTNLFAEYGEEGAMRGPNFQAYDAVIVSEVLEHVQEPWETARVAEMMARPGGKMIITTPMGPWEQGTIRQPGKWHERAHIWHLDQAALMQMFGHKKGVSLLALPVGMDNYGRPVGNTLCVYEADDEVPPTESERAPKRLDPFEKAMQHIPRQTVAAAVIAYNNEDTILKMLNSLKDQVQIINIAHGPHTDDTRNLVIEWAAKHPWIMVNNMDVPKIEPRKYGFDDARNASAVWAADCEWMIWIDTDEYLVGNFQRYLRNSALTGYIIPQHHFTVEPRGTPTQIDRPARLLRTDAGYRAVGHIHEHFQIGEGVGRVFQLPDVDLGHTGYANEQVRQGRFKRNFDFLEWDHENPQRKLHHFLWFRDIVHRLRICIERRDMEGARKLAAEGESYYNEHWEDFLSYGQGLQMSLAYISEIRHYLAKGLPMKIVLQFEDKGTQFEGRFNSYDEIERMMKKLIVPEMEDRASRYF